MKMGLFSDFISSFSSQETLPTSFNRINTPLLLSNSADSIGIHETNLAWNHIEQWLSTNTPEIYSSLREVADETDINTLQSNLSLTLPNCIIQSLLQHNGQSNKANGLFFGLYLLSVDSIILAVENWRKVSASVNVTADVPDIRLPTKSHNIISKKNQHSLGTANDSSYHYETTPSTAQKQQKKSDVPTQKSVPSNCIHQVYAHPMWIPMITDYSGNYIGVDLSPASKGTWGQIIMFGRDFDIKYKVADNWGDFLLLFVNDLHDGSYKIIEDDNFEYVDDVEELVYFDHRKKIEMAYFEVLKQRVVDKWEKDIKKEDVDEKVEFERIIKEQQQANKSLSYKNKDDLLNKHLMELDQINEPVNNPANIGTPKSSNPRVTIVSATTSTKFSKIKIGEAVEVGKDLSDMERKTSFKKIFKMNDKNGYSFANVEAMDDIEI